MTSKEAFNRMISRKDVAGLAAERPEWFAIFEAGWKLAQIEAQSAALNVQVRDCVVPYEANLVKMECVKAIEAML